jgi:hypothetical protein
MRVETLNSGDLIRTPRGYFAWVISSSGDSVRANWVGVEFPSLPSLSFKKSEIKVVRTRTLDFFAQTFKQISKEELRRVIVEERALRAKAPTEEAKVVRKRSNIKGMLKELSLEDSEALIEFIKAKRLTTKNGEVR